jgi:hypothetical protein
MDTKRLPPIPRKRKLPFSFIRFTLELTYIVSLGLIAYAQWFSNPEEPTPDTTRFGISLAVTSFLVSLFLVSNKIRYFADLRKVRTLRKSTLFIVANLSWMAYLPAAYLYEGIEDVTFGEFVKTAVPDTGLVLLLIGALNLFMWASSFQVLFPAPLFPKFNWSWKHLFWEVLFVPLVLFNQVFLFYAIKNGNHLVIPLNLVLTYALLMLRSGRLSQVFSTNRKVVSHSINHRTLVMRR